MKNYKFPRTYADLETAPWLVSTDPPLAEWKSIVRRNSGGDYLILFVDTDWIDPEIEYISPGGMTLKDALRELRDMWPHMRPPAEVKA